MQALLPTYLVVADFIVLPFEPARPPCAAGFPVASVGILLWPALNALVGYPLVQTPVEVHIVYVVLLVLRPIVRLVAVIVALEGLRALLDALFHNLRHVCTFARIVSILYCTSFTVWCSYSRTEPSLHLATTFSPVLYASAGILQGQAASARMRRRCGLSREVTEAACTWSLEWAAGKSRRAAARQTQVSSREPGSLGLHRCTGLGSTARGGNIAGVSVSTKAVVGMQEQTMLVVFAGFVRVIKPTCKQVCGMPLHRPVASFGPAPDPSSCASRAFFAAANCASAAANAARSFCASAWSVCRRNVMTMNAGELRRRWQMCSRGIVGGVLTHEMSFRDTALSPRAT